MICSAIGQLVIYVKNIISIVHHILEFLYVLDRWQM